MAQGYGITYNEFGTSGETNFEWDYIRIQNYASKPLFAEDDQTHWSTHHTISGTALLKAETDLETSIENARDKLSKPYRNLVITLDDSEIVDVGTNDWSLATGLPSGADSITNNTESTSYPRCDFQITKFYGSSNALVNFTFEWIETKLDTLEEVATWDVMSHQWRQRFVIGENGLQSWTVEGTLHVSPYAGTCSGNVQKGRNPDSYRRLVMPAIPSNFRVKAMNWATDKTGEKLIYSIEMQEHARPLPAPAKTGTGSFRFRRSLDAGAGLLGVKIFDAELEGDAKADPRQLLAALLDASTKRINWVEPKADIITSIEVIEKDIFSKKRVGLRVTAQGTDDGFISQLQGDHSGTGLNSFNFGIFENFVVNNAAVAPDEYGSALINSYRKQLFIPYAGYNEALFPKAKLMGVPGSETTADGDALPPNDCAGDWVETVYELNDDADAGLPGPDPKLHDLTGDEFDDPPDGAMEHKYLKVRGTERLGVKHNNTIISTFGPQPLQLPWQTELPQIYLESEYTLSRYHVAPPMILFKNPINSSVVDQQTSVEAGEIDGSGHRLYTRHIKRKVQLLYGWGNDAINEGEVDVTWTTDPSVEQFSITNTFFFPMVSFMSRPFDPRTDEEEHILANTVFDDLPDEEAYEVDLDIPITGFVPDEPDP